MRAVAHRRRLAQKGNFSRIHHRALYIRFVPIKRTISDIFSADILAARAPKGSAVVIPLTLATSRRAGLSDADVEARLLPYLEIFPVDGMAIPAHGVT